MPDDSHYTRVTPPSGDSFPSCMSGSSTVCGWWMTGDDHVTWMPGGKERFEATGVRIIEGAEPTPRESTAGTT